MKLFEEPAPDVVIGVDEAGRGALAGPVCVAAVVLIPGLKEAGATDSKTLGEEAREEVRARLLVLPGFEYEVGFAGIEEINEWNVLQANLRAMGRAVQALVQKVGAQNPLVLVDGNQKIPNLPYEQKTIVKGDSKEPVIGAASIFAKTSRDARMRELDKMYPAYGFATHKGYGTAVHRQALLEHGPCPDHRPVFLRNIFGM